MKSILITPTIIIVVGIMVGFCTLANESEPYGELFLLEQREIQVPTLKLNAGYEYEISQPYLSIDTVKISAIKPLSRFHGLGVISKLHFVKKNETVSLLDQELKSKNLYQNIDRPISSAFGVIETIPFFGRINFFGGVPVTFDLSVKLGAGVVFYDRKSFEEKRLAFMWSLDPRFHISDSWAIEIGINQTWESLFDSQDRLSRINAGAGVQWSL